MPPRSLQKVLIRNIRTHFTVSEVLECGHRYESLNLLADDLVAKYRVCPKCAQALSLPPKKGAVSEIRTDQRRTIIGSKKPSASVLPQNLTGRGEAAGG